MHIAEKKLQSELFPKLKGNISRILELVSMCTFEKVPKNSSILDTSVHWLKSVLSMTLFRINHERPKTFKMAASIKMAPQRKDVPLCP